MNMKIIFSTLILSLVLMGCSGSSKISSSLAAEKYANISADEALRTVHLKFENAKKSGLDFYSPKTFGASEKALIKAEILGRHRRTQKYQLKYIYSTEQYLVKAEKVRKAVEERLASVLTLKESIEKKAAKKTHIRDFHVVMREVNELIEDLESATLSNISRDKKLAKIDKSRDALVIKLQAVEMKIVKYNALNKSKNLLERAEHFNAKKVAPKTYKRAKENLKLANEYIEKHIHDDAGVKKISNEFHFTAHHLLQVTNAVNELAKLKNRNYEDRVLKDEQRLLVIGSAMQHKDLRDKSIDMQAKLLSKAIAKINTSNDEKSQTIDELMDAEQIQLAQFKVAQGEAASQSAGLNQQIAELKMRLQIREKEHYPLVQNVENLEKKLAVLTMEKNRFEKLYSESKLSSANNEQKNQDPEIKKAGTEVVQAETVAKNERLLVGESTVEAIVAGKQAGTTEVIEKKEVETPNARLKLSH